MKPGLPRFSRSSASVYYTERKPKNKKRGRPGNEATSEVRPSLMQSPTLSNSCKCLMSLLNPRSDRLWRPCMTGTMFSCCHLLATVRACSTIPHGLQAGSRRHLVLILYKAYKLHYCLDKPSVKRRTQTFTRSLFRSRSASDVTK